MTSPVPAAVHVGGRRLEGWIHDYSACGFGAAVPSIAARLFESEGRYIEIDAFGETLRPVEMAG